MINISKSTQLIKNEAKRLGLDACGISKVEILSEEGSYLKKWLKSLDTGEMDYMRNYFDKRINPTLLVKDAKSVLTVIQNYFPSNHLSDNSTYKISKYVYGEDYHIVVKQKLKELFRFIQINYGPVNGRAFVDSAPVLEKAWARQSGLGWIGKNSLLITREFGSFVFIGELILDIEFEYDSPIQNNCGNCTKCIDSCPTGAIMSTGSINSKKCISYLTVENKSSIPSEFTGKLNNWIIGCDTCQDACPFNLKIKPTSEKKFKPSPSLISLNKKKWENLSEKDYKKLFEKSAVKRLKYNRLKRNIEFVRKTIS